MFNIQALLVEDYKTIFRGTTGYLPRIGEEIAIGCCLYSIENIRHFIKEGKNITPEVHIYLKQII